MENEINKVLLDEDMVANIAGGKVHLRCTPDEGKVVYCDSNPDVRYTFKNGSKVAYYMGLYGNLDDEVGLINYLLEQNLIWLA